MSEMTEQEELHNEEIELLRHVLEPLGERRVEKLITLTREYLEEVSPITWCAGAGEPGESETAAVWEIGQNSPLGADRKVFALFYDPDARCVVAYSFSALKIDGSDDVLATYHREYIYRPRYGTGPIALNALFKDLEFHLTLGDDDDDTDDKPHRSNGA